MSNETLALGVIFFSFVIFGACLWVSVTYLVVQGESARLNESVTPPHIESCKFPVSVTAEIYSFARTDVSFLRADGHYTQVYTAERAVVLCLACNRGVQATLAIGLLTNPQKLSCESKSRVKIRADERGRADACSTERICPLHP